MSPFIATLLIQTVVLLSDVLNILELIVVASVILSWLVAFDIVNLRNRTAYQIVTLIQNISDRLLFPIRRFIPAIAGLDFSPLIFLFLCRAIQQVLLPAFLAQIGAMSGGV